MGRCFFHPRVTAPGPHSVSPSYCLSISTPCLSQLTHWTRRQTTRLYGQPLVSIPAAGRSLTMRMARFLVHRHCGQRVLAPCIVAVPLLPLGRPGLRLVVVFAINSLLKGSSPSRAALSVQPGRVDDQVDLAAGQGQTGLDVGADLRGIDVEHLRGVRDRQSSAPTPRPPRQRRLTVPRPSSHAVRASAPRTGTTDLCTVPLTSAHRKPT